MNCRRIFSIGVFVCLVSGLFPTSNAIAGSVYFDGPTDITLHPGETTWINIKYESCFPEDSFFCEIDPLSAPGDWTSSHNEIPTLFLQYYTQRTNFGNLIWVHRRLLNQ
jgi:hypothetical protein